MRVASSGVEYWFSVTSMLVANSACIRAMLERNRTGLAVTLLAYLARGMITVAMLPMFGIVALAMLVFTASGIALLSSALPRLLSGS